MKKKWHVSIRKTLYLEYENPKGCIEKGVISSKLPQIVKDENIVFFVTSGKAVPIVWYQMPGCVE